MKKVIVYTFIFVLFTCFLPNENAFSQSSGANLLVNGSFEDAASGAELARLGVEQQGLVAQFRGGTTENHRAARAAR